MTLESINALPKCKVDAENCSYRLERENDSGCAHGVFRGKRCTPELLVDSATPEEKLIALISVEKRLFSSK